MNILLTGSSGQLGKEIILQKPINYTLIPTTKKIFNLENLKNLHELIKKYNPKWIINTAAYTDVEKAEKDKDKAYLVNHLAVKSIAEIIKGTETKLIQISTDYVFDGSQKKPYKTSDNINPLNVYGRSKALAEKSIQDILKNPNQAIIIRTSWLVSNFKNNFVSKILKLHKTKSCFNVISDQIGTLTSASSLSNLCWEIINYYEKNKLNKKEVEIVHWSNDGITSWYEIAIKVGEIAKDLNLIKNCAEIIPITSEEYSASVKRPKYSALDSSFTLEKYNVKKLEWEKELKKILESLSNSGNV